MATTPEGKVKENVRKIFKRYLTVYPQLLYTYWPVPYGLGAPSLDCIGCANGRFFAVETKRDGKKPTLQQENTQRLMEAAGGKVFVVIGDKGLAELDNWLGEVLHAGGVSDP